MFLPISPLYSCHAGHVAFTISVCPCLINFLLHFMIKKSDKKNSFLLNRTISVHQNSNFQLENDLYKLSLLELLYVWTQS